MLGQEHIHRRETPDLSDAAFAQDVVNLFIFAPLMLFLCPAAAAGFRSAGRARLDLSADYAGLSDSSCFRPMRRELATGAPRVATIRNAATRPATLVGVRFHVM